MTNATKSIRRTVKMRLTEIVKLKLVEIKIELKKMFHDESFYFVFMRHFMRATFKWDKKAIAC